MLRHLFSIPAAIRHKRLFITLLIIAAIVFIAVWYRQATEAHREAAKIRVLILSMTSRRPADLTSKQWETAVAWTNNLHANSLVWGFKDGAAVRNLRLRLETKPDAPVTIDTVNWIWDQYAVLCPLGAQYQKWRKVMFDEIDDGGGNWNMVVP